MSSPITQLAQKHITESGVKVGGIGLGCMSFCPFGGKSDGSHDDEYADLIVKAVKSGMNYLDTATFYGLEYQNLRIVAKALKKLNREEYFIAVKIGLVRGPDGMKMDMSPENVRKECNIALQELGISYIDLLVPSRVDPVVPIEDTIRAVAELVSEGKVRHIGLSECSASMVERAQAVHPLATLQIEYGPMTRDIEFNGTLKFCREHKIRVVAFGAVAHGFLTHKGLLPLAEYASPGDHALTFPRVSPGNYEHNQQLVRHMKTLADELGISIAQLSLAWVLTRDGLVIPLIGTTKEKSVIEAIEVSQKSLTAETPQLKSLQSFLDNFEIKGERYPPYVQKFFL